MFSAVALPLLVFAQSSTKIDYLTQVKNAPPGAATTSTSGGYVSFVPITYNPFDSISTCLDAYGNAVQQPLPGNKQPAFGAHDLVLWNSLSPSMPFQNGTGTGLVQKVLVTSPSSTNTGPCGVPLPVETDYGLNTNGYLFPRGGLSTDLPEYNSIQSLQGGMTANSYTAGVLYPTGTVVCTATTGSSCTGTTTLGSPAYLGGHVDVGHSRGVPQGSSITASSNPFSGGEGLVAGMLYYDDALGCLNVYSGSAWTCLAPSGPPNAVQFSKTTSFGGSANFTYDDTAKIVAITGSTTAGIQAPVFSSSNTGTNAAFTTMGGTFSILGNGTASFQSIALTNGITTGSGSYGLSGSGVLTGASAGFTGGITTGSAAYGFTGSGVITASSVNVSGVYKVGGTSGFTGTCGGSPVVVGGIVMSC